MFESFLSNLSSILNSVLTIVIVIIAIYVVCLCVFASGSRGNLAIYFILRGQIRLAHWFIKSTTNFFRKHWRFAFTLTLFSALYLVFYCALPDWAEVHTVQKHLISLFSSTMITATVALLAKRKMKWLLRLAPISTVSITTILGIYLYIESAYLVPPLTMQAFPLELLAMVLIPSIIIITLAKKLHWMIKTRRQSDEAYLNTQGITNDQNPNSDPDYPDNLDENTYQPAHFSKTGENRGLTMVEKAYGRRSKRGHNSNPNSGARNRDESEPRQLLESGKRRTKKNYVKLFPEDKWDEDAEGKMEDEDF